MRPSFDDKHRLLPSEITPEQFTGAKWVVVNGYSYYSDGFLEAACDAASIAGAKVAMHLASFEIVRKFRTPLTSLLASGKVSVVFANEDEARELVGGGDASSSRCTAPALPLTSERARPSCMCAWTHVQPSALISAPMLWTTAAPERHPSSQHLKKTKFVWANS